eukprot:TRINITY_DN3987_c0_g2_i1.p1 TRINITY_DN3987_c0_g2~~TRINITY_DN3987_c0_g2_i1.p1  ORF type:complete len:270 (+),score=97.28 TRINITY_DN3987_c0_g2_i1:243-1052(+)
MVHLKTYTISLEKRNISDGAFSQKNLENAARRIAPAVSGVFVFGDQLISHLTPSEVRTIQISDFTTTEDVSGKVKHEDPSAVQEDTSISAWCEVDEKRFLLSNSIGKLYGLTITKKDKYELKLEALGHTSVPSTLSWCHGVEPGTLYVGSKCANSMLIEMLSAPNSDDQWISIKETYPNPGPIMDFVVTEAAAGSSQLVTCSGWGKDGSLRVIRKGIGFTEVAAMDLAGVQGLWSLKQSDSAYNQFIVLSFVGVTKLLELQGPCTALTL